MALYFWSPRREMKDANWTVDAQSYTTLFRVRALALLYLVNESDSESDSDSESSVVCSESESVKPTGGQRRILSNACGTAKILGA
eukprot:7611415-Pyramimonas_sp.AAC.1